MAQDREPVDGQGVFLEKIFDSDWAETIVGNLLSYVLRDSTSVRGPTAHKSKSQDALAEAVLIFKEFKKLHPGFQAVNPSNIPLGVVTDDLAPKICLDLKLHYRKLPETLHTKMERLSLDPIGLPEVEQHVEDNGKDDGTTPKMTDSFVDIREEGLMRILWRKDAGQVGQIWSNGTHTHDWAKEQVDISFGNLVKTFLSEIETRFGSHANDRQPAGNTLL
ncbi:hypothetical protein BGZ58_006833 [Dissophora ornata]|nr:hypothetical protein BGZ58_006833 [Dissophora ornata]